MTTAEMYQRIKDEGNWEIYCQRLRSSGEVFA